MKQFFKNLCFVTLAIYSIIAFVTFMPNVAEWSSFGRGAFLFVSLSVTLFGTALAEETNRK